jgi:antitoxin CcdA
MNRPSKMETAKRATNVTLSIDLVENAKRLGINVSQACESGLTDQVRKALGEEWRRDNREAVENWNKWIRENGMPYDEYRHY